MKTKGIGVAHAWGTFEENGPPPGMMVMSRVNLLGVRKSGARR